jgi:hypothetical protein
VATPATEPEQVPAVALGEGPARAQEQEPRIPADVAWQEAASGVEPRATVAQTRKSLVEVDRVPAAAREVTIAAAPGVALSLVMEVAMATAVDQAPAPE